MRVNRSLAAAAASILAILLAGCSSSPDEQVGFVCPGVVIVRDLSLITRFSAPDTQAFSGEIVGASGECSYYETVVEVSVQVSMVYDRPPDRPAVAEPIAFFVAVGRPDGTVIGKQEFASAVDFRDTETRSGFREEVDVTVPLPQGAASGEGYTVFVGFQLTAEELEYNRQRLQ